MKNELYLDRRPYVSTLYTLHIILYTLLFPLYSLHFTLSSLQQKCGADVKSNVFCKINHVCCI